MSIKDIKTWSRKRQYLVFGYIFVYLSLEFLVWTRATVCALYVLHLVILQPWMTLAAFLTNQLPDALRYSTCYTPIIKAASFLLNLLILLYLTQSEKKKK